MSRWSDIPQSIRDRARSAVFARDNYECQIRGPRCTGKAEDLDHIIPLEMGGPILDPSNHRAACAPCNRGRRQKPISFVSKGSEPASREW
jgi:5-methylcytosine-specific restriction endonuclease McrA